MKKTISGSVIFSLGAGFILLFAFLEKALLLFSSRLSTAEIEARAWKHAQGYEINDFIFFDAHLRLVNDTIFLKGEPIAVLQRGYKELGGDEEIVIKSLKTNQEGIYCVWGLKKGSHQY